MENNEIFAQFAVAILKELSDSFPIAITLDITKHIESVTTFPSLSFRSHYDVVGAGVYVGPEYGSEWGVTDQEREIAFEEFDWDACKENVELLLERELLDQEKDKLIKFGTRPYTVYELQEIDEWKIKKSKYKESQEQQDSKKEIYIGTIRFLVNEHFIRIVRLPTTINAQGKSPDILIERELNSLTFTLTNKGYMHLNKRTAVGKSNLYERMSSYVANKTVDAFADASAGALLTLFLS